MSRLKSGGFALVVLLLVASVCDAQQPGRRGAGRGRGGPGGFGGQQGAAGLLAMPEVRTELKVSDEQGAKLDTVLAAAREQLTPDGNFNFQEFQALSAEERQKRTDEFRAKAESVAKETKAKLAEILDADQMKRLDQLQLQRAGVNALTQDDVAAALGLTDEQRQKLESIQTEARQGGQRGADGGQNFQNRTDEQRRALFTEMQERRAKTEADMLGVLNDEQKAMLTEMKGAEFQFPQGGVGRGGGRNQGERRRPPRSQNNNPAAG